MSTKRKYAGTDDYTSKVIWTIQAIIQMTSKIEAAGKYLTEFEKFG